MYLNKLFSVLDLNLSLYLGFTLVDSDRFLQVSLLKGCDGA